LESVSADARARVPIWEKVTLSIDEAAAYSGIGVKKLRAMSKAKNCPFVLFVGEKCMIKRRPFEQYLEREYSV
jgi:excisionase family DNA binding protein